MGTLRGDNGGDRPPNGDGLPDLPPEWGTVIIPDDASELDREAAKVRRQLRRQARGLRWRRRLHLGPPKRHHADSPALGLPLLIMTIAIIATLTSLFALAWPGRDGSRTGTGSPPTSISSAPPIPDLTLRGPGGQQIRLRDHLPAVILLVDGCSCADLVSATGKAVAPGVTVLAVAGTAPALPGPEPEGRTIISVADREGALRTAYAANTSGVAAVLVERTGKVERVISNVTSVDDFKSALPALA